MVLIGIHIDPDLQKRNGIIKEKGLKYPVCQDNAIGKPGGAATVYHIEYIPTVFVINREGRIVALDPPNLEAAVKKALSVK